LQSDRRSANREFATDFSKHTAPYSAIRSGGLPNDGILAIDAPQFASIGDANSWLEPVEPLTLVTVGERHRSTTVALCSSPDES
jgi:hypothetical protein